MLTPDVLLDILIELVVVREYTLRPTITLNFWVKLAEKGGGQSGAGVAISSRSEPDHNFVFSIAADFSVIPHRASLHSGNGIKSLSKCDILTVHAELLWVR